jgi:hypothetical protein
MVALSAFGCADLLGSLIGTPDASSEDTPTVSGPQVTTSADIADIHGFGTIVQNADGSVSARLDVLTLGDDPRFLGGIANPTLTHAGVTLALLTGTSVGVFVTSSALTPMLSYDPGGVYLFAFEVADETGVLYSYTASVSAPNGPRMIADAAPMLIRYAAEPVELTLINASEAVSIRVIAETGTTYDTTAVSSLNEVSQVLGLMEASVGPVLEIPATAFPRTGSYRIDVTSLNVATPAEGGFAPGLGAASWFGAGTVATLNLDLQ